MDNRPIGFFDSGIGGLTSIPSAHRLLPNEQIIFFGDTARVPYGSKSTEAIHCYAEEIAGFLIEEDVKAIVIACNTVTATSLKFLQNRFKNIPFIGVIAPTSKKVASMCKDGDNVGIIATSVTVRSNAYKEELSRLNPKINVFQRACPIFVPMIEEGIIYDQIAELVIKNYLDDFLKKNHITTLVLACTHYHLLKDTIAKIYPDLNIISSSVEVSNAAEKVLKEKDLLSNKKVKEDIYYASDVSENFLNMIQLILGKEKSQLLIKEKNLDK